MSDSADRFFGRPAGAGHGPSPKRLIVLASIALLSPSLLLAQAEEKAAEQIAIDFAWPVGLKASVVARRFQVRNTGGTPDTTDVTVGYNMTVGEHADGLLIQYDDFRLLGVRTADREAVPAAQAIAEQLGALAPGLLVSRSGELLRLEGTDRLWAETRGLLAPLLDSIPGGAAQFDRLFETLLSEEVLLSQAAAEWNSLVGAWAGSELEVGAVYELEAEEYLPLSPEEPVPYLYYFSLAGRRSCHEGAAESSCVVLQINSYPEPEAVRRLIGELVETMTGQRLEGRFVYEEFQIENFVELVAEPGTLVPHALEVIQDVSGVGGAVGGPKQEFSQRRVRTYKYTYPNR
jgi:hypothetical protein